MSRHALILACVIVAITVQLVDADQTTVSFDSGAGGAPRVFNENLSTMIPLSAGTALDGDGAVLQLGYYDGATTGNNFLGNWVPLSGEGSLNTAVVPGSNDLEPYNKTSIGDVSSSFIGSGFNGTGAFGLSLNFVVGNASSGNNLPNSTTIPLAIRFYNASTIGTSTYYNVVSDDSWTWKAPTPTSSNVTISLDDVNPNLEWLSIVQGQAANTAFHTTIPLTAVPEPGTVAAGVLAAATMIGAAVSRRRKSG